MNMKKKKDGTQLTVMINGRIDTATAPEADAYINQSLDGVEKLILDFGNVNYVSSAGLRVLLSLHKKMMGKGGMKLIHVCEAVSDVFEVTGFDEILDYEKGE
ncbi:MAG: STAS domain-containing protein [Ruminococcus sp.]|nr:STAS domain-containing protein [Ruminococcus sp.]